MITWTAEIRWNYLLLNHYPKNYNYNSRLIKEVHIWILQTCNRPIGQIFIFLKMPKKLTKRTSIYPKEDFLKKPIKLISIQLKILIQMYKNLSMKPYLKSRSSQLEELKTQFCLLSNKKNLLLLKVGRSNLKLNL